MLPNRAGASSRAGHWPRSEGARGSPRPAGAPCARFRTWCDVLEPQSIASALRSPPMTIAAGPIVNQLERLDEELDTILTSFDTSYAWNYGSIKDGLRDLYEKAKRDQWNGTK